MSLKIDMKTLVLALLSGLWAFIPILTSYSANLGEVGLDFVLLFGLVCAVGTVGIFAVMTLIFKSPFAAFGSCVVGWFGVSASYSVITGIVGAMGSIPGITPLYCALLFVVMLAIGFGIKKLIARFEQEGMFVVKMLGVVVAVMLVVSVAPIVTYSIQSAAAAAELDSAKIEFVVDDTLPHPNIYWIHAESMVNEKTLEKYWGEETVGFTEKMEEKGFWVNQDATPFGGDWTTQALVFLMCPNVIDTGINGWSRDNIMDAYRHNNELLAAITNAGYNTIGILNKNGLYYSDSEFKTSYHYSKNYLVSLVQTTTSERDESLTKLNNEYLFIQYSVYPLYVVGSLCDIWDTYSAYLTEKLSPITLPPTIAEKELQSIMSGTAWLDEYGSFLNSLEYVLKENIEQKFVFLEGSFAHMPYRYDEDGERISTPYDLKEYYDPYLFSEKLILLVVEQILENDPNAIIIVQSDHGPHGTEEEKQHAFGSEAGYYDVHYHVLSAVYIPEEYRTEDYEEILSNPLNIARYLVNNFVGENYEYK